MQDSIAIISYSIVSKDSRVIREINTLKKYYKVICFGFGDNPFRDIHFINISRKKSLLKFIYQCILFLLRRYKKFSFEYFSYFFLLSSIKKYKIKYFLLNDYNSWPLLDYINGNNCILDAHEYTPEEFNNNLFWKVFIRPYKNWCSKFARKGRVNFCVEENLCNKWTRFSGKRFYLLRNMAPQDNSYYKAIINEPIKVVHHGIANESRRIDYMIKAIQKSGHRYIGYFYLEFPKKSLEKKYKNITFQSNVYLKRPIDENKLINECKKYDLAILSIFPSNTNYRYCLPNKLFQFIQSKLPIVSGPTPSISKIIKEYDIGVVANSFSIDDLKEAILSITQKDILRMKKNCYAASKELSWEKESKILIESFQEIKN